MNDEVLCHTEIEVIAANAAYALEWTDRYRRGNGADSLYVKLFYGEGKGKRRRKNYAVLLACCYAKRERLPFIMRDNRIRQHLYYFLQPDSDGNTVFHLQYHEHDDDRRLKLLLSALDYEDQEQLVLRLNNKQQSVLHILDDFLVGVLLNCCKIQPFPIECLLRTDVMGNTPLHLKPNSDNLLKYLLTQHRGMLINILKQRNCSGQNVFHTSAAACRGWHYTEEPTDQSLIWQLCDLVDIEDLTSGDKSGMSVIDYLMGPAKAYSDITEFIHLLRIPSVAASIIRKLPDCKRQQVICKVNSKRQTVLHAAVMDTWPESVSLFLGEQILWPHIDSLLQPDIEGNTSLHLAVIHARHGEIITTMLESIDKEILQKLLRCKNLKGRNVFHLAAMCNQSSWHDYLWELTDYVDGNVFTGSDIVGNNVIDYLVVTQQINNLGHVLMNCLAPSTRQKCLQEKRNHAGLRCTDMSSIHSDSHRRVIVRLFEDVCGTQTSTPLLLFDQFRVKIPVLSDLRHHIQKQMQSLVNYALHAFSLTDQSATALRTSLSSQEVTCLFLRKLVTSFLIHQ